MLTAISDKCLLDTIIHAPKRCKSLGEDGQVLTPAIKGLGEWLEIDGCCLRGLKAQVERLVKAGDLFMADGVLQVSSVAYKRHFEKSHVRRPASEARRQLDEVPEGQPPIYEAQPEADEELELEAWGARCQGQTPRLEPWQAVLAGTVMSAVKVATIDCDELEGRANNPTAVSEQNELIKKLMGRDPRTLEPLAG